ncbi:MAG TPA: hypothetical protein VGF38_21450 [Ktedonobacterales bacterium]
MRRRWKTPLLLLLIGVTLGACTPSSRTAYVIPSLNQSNISIVQAFASMPIDTSSDGRIYNLNTFSPAPGKTSFLFMLSDVPYILAEDGHLQSPDIHCDSPASVTLDGAWMSCMSGRYTNPEMHQDTKRYSPVAGGSMHQDTKRYSPVAGGSIHQDHLTLLAGEQPEIDGMYWSPDGQYLATIQWVGHYNSNTSTSDRHCSIVLYAFDRAAQTFSPPIQAQPTVPLSANPQQEAPLCPMNIAWKPDGTWLAVSLLNNDATLLLSLANLPSARAEALANRSLTVMDIPKIITLNTKKIYSPTWNPVTGTLTYLTAFDGDVINSYDSATGKETTLFTLPLGSAGHIHSLAWKPDGSALYFLYGIPQCDSDHPGTCPAQARSQVYALTSTGST